MQLLPFRSHRSRRSWKRKLSRTSPKRKAGFSPAPIFVPGRNAPWYRPTANFCALADDLKPAGLTGLQVDTSRSFQIGCSAVRSLCRASFFLCHPKKITASAEAGSGKGLLNAPFSETPIFTYPGQLVELSILRSSAHCAQSGLLRTHSRSPALCCVSGSL